MSEYYKDFLRRLIQYRLRLNMTQEEISEKLGITQSQLSKQELGKTIVPYRCLISFMKMGWDVDYLLTGRECQSKASELTEVLEEVRGTDYYRLMLEHITWVLSIGIEKSILAMGIEEKCGICILKMKSNGDEGSSILYEIRKILGEAQVTMAEKLGVNIKKYRALEKVQLHPDAELLLGIYRLTGCKPSLFLTDNCIENMIIDDLWNRIDCEKRNEIMKIVLQVVQFIRT